MKRIVLLFLSLLGISILILLIKTASLINVISPYDDVYWIEEYPGATERYIQYTPVSDKDRSVEIGPPIGADYGRLRFEDMDNDGVKEAVIETKVYFDFGDFYSPSRHILKFVKDSAGRPGFVEWKSDN